MQVIKEVHVRVAPERAFEVFVDEIGRWWPLHEGYSFGRERADKVFIEPREGGRFYERFTDGDEFTVGTVSAFEPPRRLVFTWKSPEWRGPTEVEVMFTPEDGGTLVRLEHRGWEGAGVPVPESEGYGEGWTFVIGRYAELANAA
jgi:uncharacterized protein YndB with AHSA1/START domain